MIKFEDVFTDIYLNKKNYSNYEEFKNLLIEYSKNIMNSFLKGISNCELIVKKMTGIEGSAGYDEESNTYIIYFNEKIVLQIMSGEKKFEIFSLFHEISHIFDKFNIRNNNYKNKNLEIISQEKSIMDGFPENGYKDFYEFNYDVCAIEAHANLYAARLTRDFFSKCGICLSEQEEKKLLLIEFFSLKKLYERRRNISKLFPNLNDNYLNLDLIIKEIKENYPEIYKNIGGLVVEKNFDETLSDFESQLYSEDAILNFLNITNDPLFSQLIDRETSNKPKI